MKYKRRDVSRRALVHLEGVIGRKVESRGFKAALRSLVDEDDEFIEILNRDFKRVPDGFVVDADARFVIAIEVEDMNPLSTRKIEDYAELFFSFDSALGGEWWFFLVVVDRYKNWQLLDLGEMFYIFRANRNNPPSDVAVDSNFYQWEMGDELIEWFMRVVMPKGKLPVRLAAFEPCPPCIACGQTHAEQAVTRPIDLSRWDHW